jgi:hypothetical protein
MKNYGENILFSLLVLLFLSLSCSPIDRWVPFSRSPDGSKQILISYGLFADAGIYIADRSAKNKQHLFGIAFSDCNERILKFSWSLDSSKFAFLITNSNYKEYLFGKRLIVYDTGSFPDKVEKVFDDIQHDIIDFELSNEKIKYMISGESDYRENNFLSPIEELEMKQSKFSKRVG